MTLRRKDLYFPIRKLCNIMLNVGHLKKGGWKPTLGWLESGLDIVHPWTLCNESEIFLSLYSPIKSTMSSYMGPTYSLETLQVYGVWEIQRNCSTYSESLQPIKFEFQPFLTHKNRFIWRDLNLKTHTCNKVSLNQKLQRGMWHIMY